MSLLNSKFDIVSVDNPMALAAIAQVLAVDSPPALGSEGTPTAGVIPPGAIIEMNSVGKAVLASAVNISGAGALNAKLAFVTLDGNTDFSGSFVQKLTVLAGGFTMLTDRFVAAAYLPGLQVSYGAGGNAGKIILRTEVTQPLLGVVGPAGLDLVNGVLQVIVPQGAGL